VGSQCKATVGKTHLLDYPAHEVPLLSFGLGYEWACIFRGAPLPLLGGKHELQSSLFVRRLHPKFGFGYDWGRRFCELRGCFHWQIAVLLAVNLALLFNAPSARSNVSTDCTIRIQILHVEVVCSLFHWKCPKTYISAPVIHSHCWKGSFLRNAECIISIRFRMTREF